jgi:murein DD-endopeptidase MepM/ murein hydrolase activator NlpD
MATGPGRHRRPPAPTGGAALARAAGATAVGAALPVLGAGVAHAAAPGVWERVAACESSGDWSADTGNGYFGGLQFSASTWSAYGGDAYAPSADEASAAAQISVAQRVLRAQGPGAWPVCSVRAGLTRADGDGDGAPAAPAAESRSSRTAKAPAKAAPATAAQATAAPVKTAPARTVATSATGNGTRRHTVRSGETLSGIAQELGVPGGWQQLYAQNRSVIGGDPDLIRPGQRLRWTPTAKPAEPAEPAEPLPGLPSFARSIIHHHTGADLAVPVGTPVHAVAAGTVVFAGWGGSDGNRVTIDHADGGHSSYAHLSAFDVRVGETVAAGTTIGRSGATGSVTGPRLRVAVTAA